MSTQDAEYWKSQWEKSQRMIEGLREQLTRAHSEVQDLRKPAAELMIIKAGCAEHPTVADLWDQILVTIHLLEPGWKDLIVQAALRAPHKMLADTMTDKELQELLSKL